MRKRKKSDVQMRPGRRTLMLISLLLLSSAAIRIGVGANGAVALESAVVPEDIVASAMDENQLGLQTNCQPTDELASIFEELADRETRVEEREKKIREQFASLKLAETEIRKNLVALERAEAKLSETLALADSASENDLAQLTTVYENMKPKEAAKLFQEMPPEFAAGFLGRMRAESAASIMAGLDANVAYSISVVLAGRNANVPTD